MHEVVFEKDGKMMMKNIPTGSPFDSKLAEKLGGIEVRQTT